jgi:hypothetical protein
LIHDFILDAKHLEAMLHVAGADVIYGHEFILSTSGQQRFLRVTVMVMVRDGCDGRE